MSAHPVSVFQSIIKGVSTLTGAVDEQFIFFHIRDRKHTYRMQEGDKIILDIFFCRHGSEYAGQWKEAFKAYLSHPDTGRNFEIISMEGVEERNLEKLISEIGETFMSQRDTNGDEDNPSSPPFRKGGKGGFEGELCMEFLTPFPFKVEKARHRTFITTATFIHSLERRFSRLFGTDVSYQSQNDNFLLLPYYWNYTEMRHPSTSQPGHTQYINGCAGRLYIKGRFFELLPFLLLGSELHIGTKISNSQGYYIIQKDSLPHFKRFFPNKRVILSVIRDVLDRYDNALESLSATEKFPFNEDEFSESLFQQIITNTYEPAPNTAFLIKKKGGVERMVEQPGFRDLIVQQYLLKTVSEPFDRMFEEGSIGFRKGMSRQKAVQMIQSAIKEGYQYVIESDIEDFFPSIELEKLERLLEFYIPQNDVALKNIIQKSIRNGYILNGVLHNRVKGLAQGSPLSPILANLYLDSFDEQIKKWDVHPVRNQLIQSPFIPNKELPQTEGVSNGVKMVRYADDFIILTKTKEEAGNILSKTEAFLSELGLRIKKEKTAVRHIREGFQLLLP